ncbi:MAG: hypothetical protein ISS82_01650 [Nanoarchaeota archaeon]|nr:hypothetical protein [Nanoarchaeota archaeon]
MKTKTITSLIYWILIINIPISLISSFIILAAEGNNKTINFVWNFDSTYLFTVFLGFVIIYPFLFLMFYIVSYLLIRLIRIFIKH